MTEIKELYFIELKIAISVLARHSLHSSEIVNWQRKSLFDLLPYTTSFNVPKENNRNITQSTNPKTSLLKAIGG
jgi:hypothetical protein